MNVCRVCMNDVDEENIDNLFKSGEKHMHNGKRLCDMLESVVQDFIVEQDPGPRNVCENCIEKLTTCYDFLTAYSKSKIVFHLLGKTKAFNRKLKLKVKPLESKSKAITEVKWKQAQQQQKTKVRERTKPKENQFNLTNKFVVVQRSVEVEKHINKEVPSRSQESDSNKQEREPDAANSNGCESPKRMIHCQACNFVADHHEDVLRHIESDH